MVRWFPAPTSSSILSALFAGVIGWDEGPANLPGFGCCEIHKLLDAAPRGLGDIWGNCGIPNGQHWAHCCLTSLLMTWMMGLSTPAFRRCKTMRSSHSEGLQWAERSFMKSNQGQYEVLLLGRNNPAHKYTLGPTSWKATFQVNTWGVVA